MSFRCEVCQKPQPNGVKPVQLVTETRTRLYVPSDGNGWEIVKQKNVCESCTYEIEDVGEALRAKLKPYLNKPTTEDNVEGLKSNMLDGLREAYHG